MSKIFNSINRQLKSSSSSIKLFITTNSFIKKPSLPTANTLLNSSRTLTSKHSLNFSFRRFCSISSPLTECIINYQASLSSEADGLKEEHLFTSIPVRAYYLSDSIDMEGLMVENQANLVPHTPGTGRYAVLKFDDLTNSRAPRDLGAKLIGISHSYMVVFPNGSDV
ncbi:hypothetical protein MKW98_010561 [Papaver atlanticum]|uniref:Uncharacterized protein n=1 Tax=Papaver atlanticum TaxID=357466 RepID=A0AAD4X6Q5_9MAGN|nr:hypothetical protein MKW98_010561 [Papaver atlanticum]